MPSRRDYLSGSGAALGSLLAGCSQFRESSNPSVDVTRVEHRHSAFHVNVDAAGVYKFDEQAVIAYLEVRGRGTPPEPGDVSLVAGGDTYEARTSVVPDAPESNFLGGERSYSPERGGGWLVFELPCPLDVTEATIEFPDASRSLSDDVRAALAESAPLFNLVDYEIPDAVVVGEPTTISATMRHAGGPGVLRLVFTQRAKIHNQRRVERRIPIGEETALSVTFDALDAKPEDVEDATLSISGPHLTAGSRVPIHQS